MYFYTILSHILYDNTVLSFRQEILTIPLNKKQAILLGFFILFHLIQSFSLIKSALGGNLVPILL